MKLRIPLFSLVCYFMSALPASASTCEDVINHINTDIRKNEQATNTKSFPWQNVSWLQKKLGTANKTLSPEKQTQYTWRCQSNPDVFLTISVDEQDAVIQVEGGYSSENGAGLFSEKFTQSKSPVSQQSETAQPAKQDHHDPVEITATAGKEDDTNLALEQAAKDFKTWFGLDVPKDKIIETASELLSDFYQKLKLCKPGNYKYPVINNFFGMRQEDNKMQPFANLGITTIKGFNNGKCSIILGSEASADEAHCELTQEALNFLSDKKYASGMSASFQGPADLDKFSQIMTKDCVETPKP
jgi:hypothetical protein